MTNTRYEQGNGDESDIGLKLIFCKRENLWVSISGKAIQRDEGVQRARQGGEVLSVGGFWKWTFGQNICCYDLREPFNYYLAFFSLEGGGVPLNSAMEKTLIQAFLDRFMAKMATLLTEIPLSSVWRTPFKRSVMLVYNLKVDTQVGYCQGSAFIVGLLLMQVQRICQCHQRTWNPIIACKLQNFCSCSLQHNKSINYCGYCFKKWPVVVFQGISNSKIPSASHFKT